MSFKKNPKQRLAIRLITGAAKFIMLFGGSRSGKSFILCYVMVLIALRFPGARQLIARKHFNHIKTTLWADTMPKVLRICFPGVEYVPNNVDFFIRFANGSEIWFAGLDEGDRTEKVLGMEFLNIWLNECSQIAYKSVQMVMTRLAQLVEYVMDESGIRAPTSQDDRSKVRRARNQMFFDENPPSKKHWSYVMFVLLLEPESRTALKHSRYACMQMNPEDNLENIAADYMDTLDSMTKSMQRRFKRGEFGDDSTSAYWKSADIARNRVHELPRLKRIVVSVDPAVTAKEDSDETGIVVKGLDFNDHQYTLDDISGIYTPAGWAKAAVDMYYKWNADRIVAEVNNGGDLVEVNIRTVDKYVPYQGVHATRDKATRAEPVAALTEMGMDHMFGEHPELEDQMTTWEGKKGEKSPNRIDAHVWASAALSSSIMSAVRRPRSA